LSGGLEKEGAERKRLMGVEWSFLFPGFLGVLGVVCLGYEFGVFGFWVEFGKQNLPDTLGKKKTRRVSESRESPVNAQRVGTGVGIALTPRSAGGEK